MVAFLPEINDLIEADDTSLVLLGHVVGSCSLTTLVRSDQENVKFVLVLNWRRQFNFDLVLHKLIILGLVQGLLFIDAYALFVHCVQFACGFSGKLVLLNFSFGINGSSRGSLALSLFSRSILFLFQKSVVFVICFFLIIKSLKLVITRLDLSFDFIEGSLLFITLAD